MTRKYLILISLAALFATQLLAQGDRGEITGRVTDSSGAVVPGARVTVTQKSTNAAYKSRSGTTGDFTVPSLPVGVYEIKVEQEGFRTSLTANAEITPGGTLRADVVLQVGQAQQSIEVSANAQLLQTENARVSTAVSSELVDALPVQVNGASLPTALIWRLRQQRSERSRPIPHWWRQRHCRHHSRWLFSCRK